MRLPHRAALRAILARTHALNAAIQSYLDAAVDAEAEEPPTGFDDLVLIQSILRTYGSFVETAMHDEETASISHAA